MYNSVRDRALSGIRSAAKAYVAYSPILTLLAIVVSDLLYFFCNEFYIKNYMIICVFTGVSIINSLQNIAMVQLFKFCNISKYCAYCTFLFIPIFLIESIVNGKESKFSLLFQIALGSVCLGATIMLILKNKIINKNQIKMKNWRTSILGILGAGVLLASSKGWIDADTANFIGAVLASIFGYVSTDIQSLGGTNPPHKKDEK